MLEQQRLVRFVNTCPERLEGHPFPGQYLAPGGAYYVHQWVPVVVLRQFPTLTFDPRLFVEVSLDPMQEAPPPWDSLKDVLARNGRVDEVDRFMYMGTYIKAGVPRVGIEPPDVRDFKHIWTRRHLCVSPDSLTWRYEAEHRRYVQLDGDLAVQWVVG